MVFNRGQLSVMTGLIFLLFLRGSAFSSAPIITDLAAEALSSTGISLTWSVGAGGPATAYELRYGTVAITDAASFGMATPVSRVPAPSGGPESITLNGLFCGTPFYFAIKSYDAAGNIMLSNTAKAKTMSCPSSFTLSGITTAENSFHQMTQGDFNNDGSTDLVVTTTTGHVIFYPGNGSGAFGSPIDNDIAIGAYSGSIAASDYNRDGRLDLAVLDYYNSRLWVLIGDGTGHFTKTGPILTGPEPQYVTSGDFNRDGKLDIAVSRWSPGDGNPVEIYLGDGFGGFMYNGRYGGFDSTARLESTAVADLDGDGIPDLVIANASVGPAYDGAVTMLKGNGDGSFQNHVAYPIGRLAGSISVGDVNGDGKPDVLATSYYGEIIAVLLNNGDGTFTPGATYPTGSAPGNTILTDLDGDGRLDIATMRYTDNKLYVYPGHGDGTFGSPSMFAMPLNAGKIVAGDFNRDGKPDLLLFGSDGSMFYAFLNSTTWSPAGNLVETVALNRGANSGPITVADFNSDGIPDLAISDMANSTVTLSMGLGDGTFAPGTQKTVGTYPYGSASADFDRNGVPDLMVMNNDASFFSVLSGNGDGTFPDAAAVSSGFRPQWPAVADFNGDGIPDVAVALWDGHAVEIYLGDGAGGFTKGATYDLGVSLGYIRTADFNNDGKPDLAVSRCGSGADGTVLSVLQGNGDGTFQAPQDYSVGAGPFGITVGDFNRDGNMDIAVANISDKTVSVLLNNGTGGFASSVSYGLAVGPAFVDALDLDRDGRLDLVTGVGAHVAVMRGRGDGTFYPPADYAVTNVSAGFPGAGDFDNDGKTDFAFVNGFNFSTLLNVAPAPPLPSDGLIAWWRAENNGLDSIGNHHGTWTATPAYTAGRVGYAFDLDGSRYLETPDAPSLNPDSSITIAVWYKPVSFAGSGNDPLVDKGYTSHTFPYYQYHLGVSGDQYPADPGQFIFCADNQYSCSSTPANFWTPGTWYHVVGVYDGAHISIYVNGLLIDSQPAAGVLSAYGRPLRIGAFDNYDGKLPGAIDEVQIFKRALSADEVATISGLVPNAFLIAPQDGAVRNTVNESNPLTVTGITYPTLVSVQGGEFAISADGGGTWDSWVTSGTVSLNNRIKVRVTSSGSYGGSAAADLLVGGQGASFTVTTERLVKRIYQTAFSYFDQPSAAYAVACSGLPCTESLELRMQPAAAGPFDSLTLDQVTPVFLRGGYAAGFPDAPRTASRITSLLIAGGSGPVTIESIELY